MVTSLPNKISWLCAIVILTTLSPSAYATDPTAPPPELDLSQCIQQVLSRNPDLAMAQATLAQTTMLMRSASKDRLPSLSAHYTYTHQPNSIYYPGDEFSYGISAEQPIYQGKAIISAIQQAQIGHRSAQQQTKKVMNDLAFRTFSSYFAVLRTQKIEEEAGKSVQRLLSHYHDAKAFFEAGLIPRNDYLQSDVELAQGEQDLVDAQADNAVARATLNTLLGRPPYSPVNLLDDYTDPAPPPSWEALQHEALKNRPEMLIARLQVENGERDVTIKNAPFLPRLTLSASYDKRGDSPDGSSSDQLGWPAEEKTVNAIATWKLWSWQKNNNEVAAARSALRRLKKAVNQTHDQIIIEAQTALQRLKQAEKRIKVSARAITQAEENYRITQARYQSQIATSTQVLDAQDLLTRARTNYYDAFYGHKIAFAAVQRSAGILWKRYKK